MDYWSVHPSENTKCTYCSWQNAVARLLCPSQHWEEERQSHEPQTWDGRIPLCLLCYEHYYKEQKQLVRKPTVFANNALVQHISEAIFHRAALDVSAIIADFMHGDLPTPEQIERQAILLAEQQQKEFAARIHNKSIVRYGRTCRVLAPELKGISDLESFFVDG